MNEYSIEQRIALIMLLKKLKRDVNDVIDGLITNNVQDHEVMLLCEQLIEFPESTYEIRKLTLQNITFNNMPIDEDTELHSHGLTTTVDGEII